MVVTHSSFIMTRILTDRLIKLVAPVAILQQILYGRQDLIANWLMNGCP